LVKVYHRTMRLPIACLLALLPLAAQTSAENDALAVCQKVFDGMAANDAAKILSSMTADARLYGVRANGVAYAMPADQWANRLAGMQSKFVERFTKAPVVSMHATIANVWGEYEFLRDGKFTHCGVDSFNLLKTADGWKVAAIFDTEETTGCPTAK
jgi:cyclopropane fatty-acyl-phospholipid synthase-like methyltransferase